MSLFQSPSWSAGIGPALKDGVKRESRSRSKNVVQAREGVQRRKVGDGMEWDGTEKGRERIEDGDKCWV